MELWDANLQVYKKKKKKHFQTSLFMYFAFIFSEYITITSSEDFEKVRAQFLAKTSAESSVTCNLPVYLRFI